MFFDRLFSVNLLAFRSKETKSPALPSSALTFAFAPFSKGGSSCDHSSWRQSRVKGWNCSVPSTLMRPYCPSASSCSNLGGWFSSSYSSSSSSFYGSFNWSNIDLSSLVSGWHANSASDPSPLLSATNPIAAHGSTSSMAIGAVGLVTPDASSLAYSSNEYAPARLSESGVSSMYV